MKRFAVTIAVVAAHVLLAAWLFMPVLRQEQPNSTTTEDNTGQKKNALAEDSKAPQPASEKHAPGDNTANPAPLDKLTFEDTPATALPARLQGQTEAATAGIVVDWTNKRILWQKKGRAPIPIASMTKMMTVLLLVEAVENHPDLDFKSRVKVTKSAADIGGRQVYLDPRETFTIDEILKCIMIFSANDAAYLAAEYLANGDADMFVQRMNRRAEELTLDKAEFSTPHGLPADPPDQAAPLELAYLAARLLMYPRVVHWSSTRLSWIRKNHPTFSAFRLDTTNDLLNRVNGVNGMKTGFTQEAGHCMAATCQREGRTMIAVVCGCPTSDARNNLLANLLEWSYEQ